MANFKLNIKSNESNSENKNDNVFKNEKINTKIHNNENVDGKKRNEESINDELSHLNKKSKKNKKKNKVIKNEDNPDFDLEESLNKEYLNFKIKKIALTSFLAIFMIFIIIFGVFNTFIKTEKSPQELAAIVNRQNLTTSFPGEGVETYIKQNFETLFDQYGSVIGSKEIKVNRDKIFVNLINRRTNEFAYIYFTASLKIEDKEYEHNFILPLKYDYDNRVYIPAGSLEISPIQFGSEETLVENDLLSFNGISEISDDNTVNSAKIFIENFFIMVYNEEGDISQMYDGNRDLGDPKIKYNEIREFKIYESDNKDGYNAYVKYNITLNEGVSYDTISYLKIEPVGNSWVLHYIL